MFTTRSAEKVRAAEYGAQSKAEADPDMVAVAETIIERRKAKFDPAGVSGPLPGCASRAGRRQAQGPRSGTARGRRAVEGHQPDGRAEAQPRPGGHGGGGQAGPDALARASRSRSTAIGNALARPWRATEERRAGGCGAERRARADKAEESLSGRDFTHLLVRLTYEGCAVSRTSDAPARHLVRQIRCFDANGRSLLFSQNPQR